MGLVIFGIVILIVNIVMWFFCFKFFRGFFSTKGALNEVKQEAEKIIIEIGRQTDTAVTVMEGKFQRVREIVEIADKKIMLYENTLIQKENERLLYQQLTEFQQNETPIQRAVKVYSLNDISDKTEPQPLFTENAGTSDLKKSKAMKKNVSSEVKTEESNSKNFELDFSENNEMPKIQQVQKIQPKVPVQQQIIELANQGFTADLIASKLNISINEVTMTIDLFV